MAAYDQLDSVHKARFVQSLQAVVSKMAEEFGAPPTLAEFLGVLASSMPARGSFEGLTPAGLTLEPRLQAGRRIENEIGRIWELNDSSFVAASEFLAEFDAVISDLLGRPATLIDLQEVLFSFLGSDPGLADIGAGDVRGIVAKVRKAPKRVKVGDIFAIPTGGGAYLAVVLDKSRFGIGLGLYYPPTPVVRPESRRNRSALPIAIYTDQNAIAEGNWLPIGSDQEWVADFPPPEIFHQPALASGAEAGLAERSDGTLRPLSASEAKRIGLLEGRYQQVVLSEAVPSYVEANHARWAED